MSFHVRRIAASALCVFAATAATTGHSAVSFESTTNAAATASASVPLPGAPTSLLAYTVDHQRALELSLTRSPLGFTEAPAFVPPDVALRNPLSGSLRTDADLFLWNYVAMLHAQKEGSGFDLEETRVATVVALPPVSPVPLPTAKWLLIVIALGMVGARHLLPRQPSAEREAPNEGVARLQTA